MVHRQSNSTAGNDVVGAQKFKERARIFTGGTGAQTYPKTCLPSCIAPAPKFSLAVIKSKKSFIAWAEFELMAKRAKQASAFLEALSHEFRLLILCLLCEGKKTVTDLEELLSLRQSSVSQHLARLRHDGLVKTKRNGKVIHYSLANDDVRLLLGTLRDVFCKSASCRAR